MSKRGGGSSFGKMGNKRKIKKNTRKKGFKQNQNFIYEPDFTGNNKRKSSYPNVLILLLS